MSAGTAARPPHDRAACAFRRERQFLAALSPTGVKRYSADVAADAAVVDDSDSSPPVPPQRLP